MIMPALSRMMPQNNWPENFNKGFVLYASSASPIKKPTVEHNKIASWCLLMPIAFTSEFICGYIEHKAKENRNRMKNEIPPKAGLVVLAQRTISVSAPLRIPKFLEKCRKRLLTKIERNTPTINNMKEVSDKSRLLRFMGWVFVGGIQFQIYKF